MIDVRYDREADAAYVHFVREKVAGTQEIDDSRLIDYGASGTIIGVEFLEVEGGVRLAALPIDHRAVSQALRAAGICILDDVEVTGDLKVALLITTNVFAASSAVAPPVATLAFAPAPSSTPWKTQIGEVTPQGRVTVPALAAPAS